MVCEVLDTSKQNACIKKTSSYRTDPVVACIHSHTLLL